MNEVLIRMESVDLVYFPPSLPGGWLGGGRNFEGIVWVEGGHR